MLYKIKVRKEHLKEFFENFDARKMGLKILFAKENCNYKTKRKQEKVYITDELYAILSIDKMVRRRIRNTSDRAHKLYRNLAWLENCF